MDVLSFHKYYIRKVISEWTYIDDVKLHIKSALVNK